MDTQPYPPKKQMLTYIVFFLLVGVVGLGGFYIGQNFNPVPTALINSAIDTSANSISSAGEESTNRTPTEKAETRELKFMYGQIIEKNENKFLIQQLLLTGAYGATIYLVQADDRTHVEYVPKATLKGEPGTLDGIKKEMYVFIATRSQLVASPAIYAESISYSEVSPIRERGIAE